MRRKNHFVRAGLAATALSAVLLFWSCSEQDNNPATPFEGVPEPAISTTGGDGGQPDGHGYGDHSGGDTPQTNCYGPDVMPNDSTDAFIMVTPMPGGGITPDCRPIDTLPVVPLPDTIRPPNGDPPPVDRPVIPRPDFYVLECDRTGLSRALGYFGDALMLWNDHNRIPLTDDATYLEKDYTTTQAVTREIPFSQSRLWSDRPAGINHRNPSDERFDNGSCAASAEFGTLGVRLQLADGKISEIFVAIRNPEDPNFDLDRCLANPEDCAPALADGPQRGISCTNYGLTVEAMTDYQTAMSWVDHRIMRLADNAKYIEADYTGSNAVIRELPFGEGLWKTHIQWNGWSVDAIIFNAAACAVFTEMPVLVSTWNPATPLPSRDGCAPGDVNCYRNLPTVEFTSREPYVHGIRLKVSGNQISEVLVIRADVNGRRFNGERCLTAASVEECLQ